jgi:hypothetical protein
MWATNKAGEREEARGVDVPGYHRQRERDAWAERGISTSGLVTPAILSGAARPDRRARCGRAPVLGLSTEPSPFRGPMW